VGVEDAVAGPAARVEDGGVARAEEDRAALGGVEDDEEDADEGMGEDADEGMDEDADEDMDEARGGGVLFRSAKKSGRRTPNTWDPASARAVHCFAWQINASGLEMRPDPVRMCTCRLHAHRTLPGFTVTNPITSSRAPPCSFPSATFKNPVSSSFKRIETLLLPGVSALPRTDTSASYRSGSSCSRVWSLRSLCDLLSVT
jgi:hypothetical protein